MSAQRSLGAQKTRKAQLTATGPKLVRKAADKPKPVKAKPLRRDQPMAEAATAMTAAAVARLDACWRSVLDDNTPDRVHRFRVALRQLRVVLHVFRKVDGSGRIEEVRKALAQVALEAGRQRDLDVLIDDMVRPLQGLAATIDMSELIGLLEVDRSRARGEAAAAIGNRGTQALRRQLADLPKQLGVSARAAGQKATIGKFAHRDLQRRWGKLASQAEDLKDLDAAGLHEMRKSLKNLRYVFGYVAPFWEQRGGAQFGRRLQRLQATFGYLNDVANAEQRLQHLTTEAASRELAMAVGFVLGTHSERARQAHRKILKQWRKLAVSDVGRALSDP